MSLRDVVEHRVQLVFNCRSCLRAMKADALALVHRYGPEAKLASLRARARCSNCKKRAVDVLLRKPNAMNRREGWIPYPPADPMR